MDSVEFSVSNNMGCYGGVRLQKDVNSLMGKTLEEKLTEAWDRLQLYVNCVADGDADKMNREFSHGVKQVSSEVSVLHL